MTLEQMVSALTPQQQYVNPGMATDSRWQNHVKNNSPGGQSLVQEVKDNSVPYLFAPSTIVNNDNSEAVKTITTFLEAMTTSALEAEKEAAIVANNFNASEAEKNRVFQQSSADKAMKFEAEQAEKQMAFQQSSAQAAMDFEAEQAQKQMDFQERMSNSVYQRAVQDLKAAGLSPLLAYSHLSTSSPSGSSGSAYSSSGAMASGRSASGSSASAVKANPSAGKTADISSFKNIESALIALGVASAVDLSKFFVK